MGLDHVGPIWEAYSCCFWGEIGRQLNTGASAGQVWVVHPLSRTASLLGKVSARAEGEEWLLGVWGGKGFREPGSRGEGENFSWFWLGKMPGGLDRFGDKFLQPGYWEVWKKFWFGSWCGLGK